MQNYPFVVDETPYCLWDWDIRDTNLQFLDSIDAAYFANTVAILARDLEADNRHHAGLAIRLMYFQAMETFFAFLCAFVQAPHAPVGWVSKYRASELRSVVKKLMNGEHILTRLKVSLTWMQLSSVVHQFQLEDIELDQAIKHGFADFWRKLANDFTDKNSTDEYNSVKHGIRVRSGGYSLAFGKQDHPHIPAPPEKMRVIGSSKFGSMYHFAEPVTEPRHNIRMKNASQAWDPHALARAIQLLSFSISNVVSILKIASGCSPHIIKWEFPADINDFELPWKSPAGAVNFQINSSISRDDLQPMSRDDVLASYKSN